MAAGFDKRRAAAHSSPPHLPIPPPTAQPTEYGQLRIYKYPVVGTKWTYRHPRNPTTWTRPAHLPAVSRCVFSSLIEISWIWTQTVHLGVLAKYRLFLLLLQIYKSTCYATELVWRCCDRQNYDLLFRQFLHGLKPFSSRSLAYKSALFIISVPVLINQRVTPQN